MSKQVGHWYTGETHTCGGKLYTEGRNIYCERCGIVKWEYDYNDGCLRKESDTPCPANP